MKKTNSTPGNTSPEIKRSVHKNVLNMTATLTALFGERKFFNRIHYLLVSTVSFQHDVRIAFSLEVWIGLSPIWHQLRLHYHTQLRHQRCRISAGMNPTRSALQSQLSLTELCWKPKSEEAARETTQVPAMEKTQWQENLKMFCSAKLPRTAGSPKLTQDSRVRIQ